MSKNEKALPAVTGNAGVTDQDPRVTDQAPPSTGLQTIEEDGKTVVHQPQSVAEKLLSGANGNFITSIKDDGTTATRARIFNSISDNTDRIKAMIGQVLEVTDIMAYPVSLVNMDGELVDAVRVVIITKDGKSYGSVANGVFTSLQQIIAICGMPPWEGIKLVPQIKTTRRGFDTLVFRMEA